MQSSGQDIFHTLVTMIFRQIMEYIQVVQKVGWFCGQNMNQFWHYVNNFWDKLGKLIRLDFSITQIFTSKNTPNW